MPKQKTPGATRARCVTHDKLGCVECFPKGIDPDLEVSGNSSIENLLYNKNRTVNEVSNR